MILIHYLPAILLSLSFGVVSYFVYRYDAKRKFDPNDLTESYVNLKGYGLLVLALLVSGIAGLVLFIQYIKWVDPEILNLTDNALYYLAVFWFAGPIVAVGIGSHAGVAPYWGELFEHDTTHIQMFFRRISVFLIGIVGAIIAYVLLQAGSLSLTQFIFGLGVVFLAPVLQSAVGPRIMDWWSLRRRPIEETDYLIDVKEINDYSVMVEQSFLSDGSNAHAEGFRGVRPSICLGENVFTSLSNQAREATIYHELGHHRHNDQLKQSLLIGAFLVVAAIVGTGTLNTLISIFGNQENDWIILVGVVVSVVIVLYIENVVAGYISRKAEYAADDYAAEKVGASAMIEALNEEDETSRRLWNRLIDTHPSRKERVENLRNE